MGFLKDHRGDWVVYVPRQRDMAKAVRRKAQIQSQQGAKVEFESLMRQVFETGTVDEQREAPLPAAAVPTVDQFWTTTFVPEWMPAKCRPSTSKRYRELYAQGLQASFGAVRLDAITPALVTRYEATLSKRRRVYSDGRKKIGVQARPHVALLRSILTAAVAMGAVARDQTHDLPLPKKSKKLPAAPTQKDVDAWLAQPMTWVVLAVAIAVFTGARQGEIRELRVKDVSLVDGRITIRRALSADVVSTPKSGADRVVPVIPELRAILEPAMKRKLPAALIVTDEHGRAPRRQEVLQRFKALCVQAGTGVWSFHSLRHHFVTSLLRHGVGAEVVRVLAGHSKLDVTQRYAHAIGADLVEAMDRLSVSKRMGGGKERT